MPQSYVTDGKFAREAVADTLRKWLDAFLPQSKLALQYEVRTQATEPSASEAEFESPEVVVVLRGSDQGLLLERNAELLLALEYLAVRSLRLEPPFFDRVRFDAGNYREQRITELKLAAQAAAGRVRETRQAFRFNPMAARERRVVHLALKDLPGIRTSSDGQGDERRVVIYPSEQK